MNKKTLEEEHEAALQEKERVIESLQEKLNAKEDEVRSLEEGKNETLTLKELLQRQM